MTKAICKILLFLTLVLVASQLLIQPFVYHPLWGDPNYIAKYDRFTADENQYNTVFIGTSRTFRHTDPAIFDSITGLRSFNFGIDGDGCPANYMLAKELFEIKKMTGIKYLVLELFPPSGNLAWDMSSGTLHTDKVLYKYGLEDYCFVIRSLCEIPEQKAEQLFLDIRSHVINLLESSFKLGFVHRILNAKSKGADSRLLGKMKNGFLAYDHEMILPNGEYLLKRHNEFVADSGENSERAEASVPGAVTNSEGEFRFHKDYLYHIEQICNQNGVVLILVVHPRMSPEQLGYFHAFLADTTLQQRLIILDHSNFKRYPEYYELENAFDAGHLNSKGATQFTINLASDVNHIINK